MGVRWGGDLPHQRVKWTRSVSGKVYRVGDAAQPGSLLLFVALRTSVSRAPQAEPAEREVADRGGGKAIVSVNLKSHMAEMVVLWFESD